MRAGHFIKYINDERLRLNDEEHISNFMSLPVRQASIFGSNLTIKHIKSDTKEIVLEPIQTVETQLIEIYDTITKKVSADIEVLNQYSIVIEYTIAANVISLPVVICGVLVAGLIRSIETVEREKEVFFLSTENDLDMGEFLDSNIPYMNEDYLDNKERMEQMVIPTFEKLWLMDIDPLTLKRYLNLPECLIKAYMEYCFKK